MNAMEKALKQHNELLAMVIRHLPPMTPEIKQKWIENPKALSAALRRVLSPCHTQFSVWQTVEIGRHTAAGVTEQITRHNNELSISDVASELMQKVTPEPKPMLLELVCITGCDLGLSGNVSVLKVLERAYAFGLRLCPQITAAELALQHACLLAKGERIVITSQAIKHSDQKNYMFELVCEEEGCWIDGFGCSPRNLWPASWQWVFVRDTTVE